MNTQQHPDNAPQGHLDQVFPMMMKRIFAPLPWRRYFRRPSDRVFERHLAKVHEAVGVFIRAACERMAEEPALNDRPTNLLEALIAARDDEGSGLPEEGLIGNVLTVLLAGEGSTANASGWTLHLLHTNRDAWNDVVAKVEHQRGARARNVGAYHHRAAGHGPEGPQAPHRRLIGAGTSAQGQPSPASFRQMPR